MRSTASSRRRAGRRPLRGPGNSTSCNVLLIIQEKPTPFSHPLMGADPPGHRLHCFSEHRAGESFRPQKWRRYKRRGPMTSDVIVTRESTSLISRSVLVVFCLAAGLAYRASVSLIPTGILEDSFLLGLAVLLLIVAVLARRSENLRRYWEIPFAFFVFTVAGFVGDVSISPLQQWFIHDVLHETPNVHNPLAPTVLGTVLAQLFGTLSLALPIIVPIKVAGSGMVAIFINQARCCTCSRIGTCSHITFFLLAAFGLSKSFFPNNGVTLSRFLA